MVPPSPPIDGQTDMVALEILKHDIVYGRFVLKVGALDSLVNHQMTLLEGTELVNVGNL